MADRRRQGKRRLTVRNATPAEEQGWDALVRRFDHHRVVHTRAWLRSLEASGCGRPLYLIDRTVNVAEPSANQMREATPLTSPNESVAHDATDAVESISFQVTIAARLVIACMLLNITVTDAD